MLEQVGDL
jgi:hypothetical protein